LGFLEAWLMLFQMVSQGIAGEMRL